MDNATVTTTLDLDPAPLGLTISRSALLTLSATEMRGLVQATRTLLDVGDGLACQPRFHNGADNRLNGAGEILEMINESLGELILAIVTHAKEHAAPNPKETEAAAWTVLDIEAGWGSDLYEFSAMAATAAHNLHTAEGNQRLSAELAR